MGEKLKSVFGHFGKLNLLLDIRWELVYVHSVSFSHIFILFSVWIKMNNCAAFLDALIMGGIVRKIKM